MQYFVSIWIVLQFPIGICPRSVAVDYDPLRVAAPEVEPNRVEPIDLDVNDTNRNRVIPVKVYLPASKAPEPMVLFSHGLGGDREGGAYLGKHWSARGYFVVVIQHPGSDSSIWKNQRAGQRQSAMTAAASPQNLLDRIEDVKTVLDTITVWNRESGHAIAGRVDLDHIGMSGHSFGAMTTQAVSGQQAGRFGRSRTDARIKAAIVMSPSTPQRGDASAAFGKVNIPWLLMTGTKDVSQFGNQTLESRRAVYIALPPGDKYELLLHNAEHSAFGDNRLRGENPSRDPNHHRVILALSTAFWDAYLRGEDTAKTYLQGPVGRAVLGTQDQLQMK